MVENVPDSILQRTRDIASGVVRRQAEAVDTNAAWPEASIRALQKAGLGGLVVPTAAGGLGQGMLALSRVCEILGRECPSTALCFGMHTVATAVIAARATAEQQADYLEPIARGEHLTTLALSEPGTGSHFYLPQTRLVGVEDGYVVSGHKSFVTNAGHADSYVASVVSQNGTPGHGEFSCVVVDRDAEGVELGGPWRGLGMRGNDSRSVFLRDARLPHGALLGEEGDEIWYVFHVVTPNFLMAMAGTYLGIASAAIDEAAEHLSEREYDGGGVDPGRNSILQRDLGRCWSRVEATRQLIYRAAAIADAGGDDAMALLCAAKAQVAEVVVEAVNEALTLTGGRGYADRSRLGRMLRDARAAHVMAPTTQILEVWIGRILLGLPLLGG